MGPELRLAAEREVADPESAEPEPARYQLVEDSAQPVSSEPGWAKDLVDTVAEGMAGPVFHARVNPGCRTCPVASCCPVNPEGEQVTP